MFAQLWRPARRAPLTQGWSAPRTPDAAKRKTYLSENDLDGLPLDLADYLLFFEERKKRIRDRLVKALGATTASESTEE